MSPPLVLPDFVARWQAVTPSERSAAQSHFIELCDVLGQPCPVAVDQAGAFYTFETVHTADRRHPHPADRLQRPWPPGCEPTEDPRVEAVAHAARELVERRDAWLNPPDASEAELGDRTLTRLYNARPARLDQAHRKLDRAVLAAYGWPRELSDDEILERLLALNLQREPA